MKISPCALLLALFLTACQPAFLFAPLPTLISLPTPSPQPSLTPSSTPPPTFTPLPTQTLPPGRTPEATATFTPGPIPLPATLVLDPADWKNWPVLPVVTQRARQIYQLGQALGNNPHAFSVFGDCQSEPDVFMGIFETDPALVANLPSNLQETVAWFAGSFTRESPTVKGGTTAGALMYSLWHQNKYTCTAYETPIQCEFRLHKPAFVIIHVGTHYESRNDIYMRKVLDQVIAAGVVPILATKADDSELNEHINAQYASLAVEYAIPFWNFWAAVRDLPNHGLYTRPYLEIQGDIYLNDEAANIQRMFALLALDTVRRAVAGK
jgi:hypothetical protein